MTWIHGIIVYTYKDTQEQSYLHVDTTWKHECPNETQVMNSMTVKKK